MANYRITLDVDEKWLEAIKNLTNDVYDGELLKWVTVVEIPHLRDMTWQQLAEILCEDCRNPDMNMSEYACRTHIKDNQPVCVECCGCCE
jgi:hypothetical protein